MAVMKQRKPTAPVPEEHVKVQPESFKGITVDSKATPPSTLATFLEGQSWVVDYYSQIVDLHDRLSSQEVGMSAVYQSYKVIRGFELKVTSPLSTSQNDETKEMVITGSANVYSVLIPNVGDMFIADVGDGREGIFTITGSSRKSIFKETAHEVDYKMVGYNNATNQADLDRKVVDTLYFDRDYLRTGYNPLLRQGTVDVREELSGHYSRLLTAYFNDFFSREHMTLIIPNQETVTYDPFLTRFLVNILSVEEHPYIRDIHLLNVSEDLKMYEFTLWNCLERMDHRFLQLTVDDMCLVPSSHFLSRPVYGSIYYSKVKRVVYPEPRSTNVDARHHGHRVGAPELKPGLPRFAELTRSVERFIDTDILLDDDLCPEPEQPLIHLVTCDKYYVLSRAFYKNRGLQSTLENLVSKALKGESLDLNVLNEVCNDALNWHNVERFYYFPILFTLLRVYPRGL